MARTLKATTHDSGVIEVCSDPKCKVAGNLTGGVWDKMHEQSKRVYDPEGISPTVHTCGGGNLEPKILIPQATEQGYATSNTLTTVQKDNLVIEPKLVGGVGEINFGTQYRQGNRVYDSDAIAMALMAGPVGNAGGNSYLYKVEEPQCRVRKLTPKECWRLMGFTDEDFGKAKQGLNEAHYKGKDRSNSQLYKQAGNSIVKQVLMAIFGEMKGDAE